MPTAPKFEPTLYEVDEDKGDSFERIVNQYQGNKVLVAKAFGIHYSTLERYIARTPGAKELVEKSWTIRNAITVAIVQQSWISMIKNYEKFPNQAVTAGKYYLDNYGHLLGVGPKEQSQVTTDKSTKLDELINQSYQDLISENDIDSSSQVSTDDLSESDAH